MASFLSHSVTTALLRRQIAIHNPKALEPWYAHAFPVPDQYILNKAIHFDKPFCKDRILQIISRGASPFWGECQHGSSLCYLDGESPVKDSHQGLQHCGGLGLSSVVLFDVSAPYRAWWRRHALHLQSDTRSQEVNFSFPLIFFHFLVKPWLSTVAAPPFCFACPPQSCRITGIALNNGIFKSEGIRLSIARDSLALNHPHQFPSLPLLSMGRDTLPWRMICSCKR